MPERRTTRPEDLDRSMVELLRLLPGYDPFALATGYWFDEERATRACRFFPDYLRHCEGELAGEPFDLEPWQLSFVANLFGWYGFDRYGRVVRRYLEAMLYVARKNGKTPLSAGICNYCLFCEGEIGAQIYSAAASADQAAILYKHAKGQVQQEPELMQRARIYAGYAQRAILNTETNSAYRVLSKGANTQHGLNTSVALIDELHAIEDVEFIDAITTSTASKNRLHPLLIWITTADSEGDSVCNQKHEYACRVRDGEIEDPRFLPAIYEATADDDITDPETWRKANPNLDVSVSHDYLARESLAAVDSPTRRLAFQQFHLNVQVQSRIQWLSLSAWDECQNPEVSELSLEGEECYAGLDASSTSDLTSLVLFFPARETRPACCLLWCWCPDTKCDERERLNTARFRAWANAGYLLNTEGDQIDYREIRATINELGERFAIREIAVDRWNTTQLTQQLRDEDGFEVIGFGQGMRDMCGPCRDLETMIGGQEIHHDGHPVLRWAISNAVAFMDEAGNIKPDKKHSRDKIDPVVALIMAIGRANNGGSRTSVYEDRGVLVI